MAKQTINLGTTPNDHTGDQARTAFDKCNDNFSELYDGLDGKADATHTHAISDTTGLQAALDAKLNANDASVTNARTPTGGAGGVLGGTYPNPGFAVDMATQAELESGLATKQPLNALLTAFAALANTAGVLTNNGAGVLSWEASAGGGTWGSISGTLADQTDLQAALDAKASQADLDTLSDTVSGSDAALASLISGKADVAEVALKAPLASPALTGTPTAPTASNGTNTTQIATTAFVQTALGSYLPLAGGTLTGALISSTNGAASTPACKFTGTPFSGGTATTTKPLHLIEPTGTTSTGWSTSGTMFGVNAASAFVGNLIDLQLNGSSKLKVGYDGVITLPNGAGLTTSSGSLVLGPVAFSGGAYITLTSFNVGFGNARTTFMDSNDYFSGGYQVQFANARADAADVGLVWGSAGYLKVSNGSTGVGSLQFGVHSALGAETVTGYITVKDGAGTTRKLAVIS
jgi:hypothetical protein